MVLKIIKTLDYKEMSLKETFEFQETSAAGLTVAEGCRPPRAIWKE